MWSKLLTALKHVKHLASFEADIIPVSNHKVFKEVKIPSPWGNICGKWWGSEGARPILCLHNINENAGTFDRLIPILSNDVGFLAIDLLGHGKSSSIPQGIFYNDMLYLSMIQHIKEYFKWNHVTLMGHSSGGVLSYLYSLLNPTTVDMAIFIDGLYPSYPSSYNFAERTCMDINKLLVLARKSKVPNPPISPIELERSIYLKSKKSIDLTCAHHIATRELCPLPKKPHISYSNKDPRLALTYMNSFCKDACLNRSRQVSFPFLIIKTKNSPCFPDFKEFLEHYKSLTFVCRECVLREVEGGHHVHLNKPEKLADIINTFLKRYGHAESIVIGHESMSGIDLESHQNL